MRNKNTVNFNSFIPVSTCDYYGKASCVVFFNGCNFRCEYCYNKQTWKSMNHVDIDRIETMIKSALPFVSAVTFSGGEPYMQSEALQRLIKYAQSIGLYVAVETNGYYENRIYAYPKPDELYVDIKAPVDDKIDYYNKTGIFNSSTMIKRTLDSGLPTEIRIVDNLEVKRIKESLKDYDYPIRILHFRKNMEIEI